MEPTTTMVSWPDLSSTVTWSQLAAKARLQLHGSSDNDGDGEMASLELCSSSGNLVCCLVTSYVVAPATPSANKLACWMTASGAVACATMCEHLQVLQQQ